VGAPRHAPEDRGVEVRAADDAACGGGPNHRRTGQWLGGTDIADGDAELGDALVAEPVDLHAPLVGQLPVSAQDGDRLPDHRPVTAADGGDGDEGRW
jgi:hypothetical protein